MMRGPPSADTDVVGRGEVGGTGLEVVVLGEDVVEADVVEVDVDVDDSEGIGGRFACPSLLHPLSITIPAIVATGTSRERRMRRS
jgi:hypothetical protein